MNNSARTKPNKFCSYCKRTNHTRDECYHRRRRFIEKQTRYKHYDTEPRKLIKVKLNLKTHKRGKFDESHDVKTVKETPRDSNDSKNREEINTKRSNVIVKSDEISKIELKLKIKRLKNKLEKLVAENKFLKEENLSLSLLYFSSDKTPFIDNWKKDIIMEEKTNEKFRNRFIQQHV